MKKKLICAVCGLLAFSVAIAGVRYYMRREKIRKENNAYYEERIQREKRWILNNRTSDGAILTYDKKASPPADGKYYINPYFACIAARGLLRGEVTEEQRNAVKAYLRWHTARLEADGRMMDYEYYEKETDASRWKSKGNADSTDSYAALYLILAAEYYKVTKDAAFIQEIENSVVLVARKLLKMQQADGLMIMSEDRPIKYIMDNAEVNLALRELLELIRALPSLSPELPQLGEALKRNTAAIKSLLWDAERGEYHIGLDSDGRILTAPSLEKLYPFWISQLFPQLHGFKNAFFDSGKRIYENFCRNITWTDLSFRHSDSTSYWCALLYCASLNRDKERVEAYIASFDSVLGEERAYPYYCAESGWAILAYEQMKY